MASGVVVGDGDGNGLGVYGGCISDFAGNTIARPDAILSGALFAFTLTLIIYLIAKQSGYPLTGTETIAAFIIGWAVGNIVDFAKKLIRGR